MRSIFLNVGLTGASVINNAAFQAIYVLESKNNSSDFLILITSLCLISLSGLLITMHPRQAIKTLSVTHHLTCTQMTFGKSFMLSATRCPYLSDKV